MTSLHVAHPAPTPVDLPPLSLEDMRSRLTVTVPEAGQLLSLGRGAAYAAAKRGEIPTLTLGRRLVVPVPKLLELLGFPPESSGTGP